MFRLPLKLIATHVRSAAVSASGDKPQTVVAPLTGRGGFLFKLAHKIAAKRARPMPVPVRTMRKPDARPYHFGWGMRKIYAPPGIRGGFSRVHHTLSQLRPLIARKMAEGKPYAMAFEEAKRELEI